MRKKDYDDALRKIEKKFEEKALFSVLKADKDSFSYLDVSTCLKREPPDFLFNDGKYGFEITKIVDERIVSKNKELLTVSLCISDKVSKRIGKDVRCSFMGHPWIDFNDFGRESQKAVINELVNLCINENVQNINGYHFFKDLKNYNVLNYYFGCIYVSDDYSGFSFNQIINNKLDKKTVLNALNKKQNKTNYPNIPICLIMYVDAYFDNPLNHYSEDIKLLKSINYSVFDRFEKIYFVYFENNKELVERLK